jgi:hypothetical protein
MAGLFDDTMPSRPMRHARRKRMMPSSSIGFYRTAEDLNASLHGRTVRAWLNGEVAMVAAMG